MMDERDYLHLPLEVFLTVKQIQSEIQSHEKYNLNINSSFEMCQNIFLSLLREVNSSPPFEVAIIKIIVNLYYVCIESPFYLILDARIFSRLYGHGNLQLYVSKNNIDFKTAYLFFESNNKPFIIDDVTRIKYIPGNFLRSDKLGIYSNKTIFVSFDINKYSMGVKHLKSRHRSILKNISSNFNANIFEDYSHVFSDYNVRRLF